MEEFIAPQATSAVIAKDDLDEFVRDYITAFNSGNARRLAEFYTDDAVAVPPRGPELRGRSAILAYYLGALHKTEPQLLDYEPEWQIEGDLAAARESWSVSLTEGRGHRKLRKGWGMWSAVRLPGLGWKIRWIIARFADTE